MLSLVDEIFGRSLVCRLIWCGVSDEWSDVVIDQTDLVFLGVYCDLVKVKSRKDFRGDGHENKR